MLAVNCKNYLKIASVQIKLSLIISFLAAFILFLSAPLVFGIKNLDTLASSFVLERFISLVGILLFTPIFFAETDVNIKEVVDAKTTSQIVIYLIRILLAFVVMTVLITGFTGLMQYNDCVFPNAKFILGTMATALFIGGLGFMTAAITNNVIIGYMVSFSYFAVNMFLPASKLGNFYLFSLSINSLEEKYWIFATAILFFIAGIVYKFILSKTR